jgi:tRNA modification GTPase
MNAPATPVCARLTPAGEGGIHTVGVFGPGARETVRPLFRHRRRRVPNALRPGKLYYGGLYRGAEMVDEVILAVPHPRHALTGEETVEIHCHGGVAASRAVMAALGEAGVEPVDAEGPIARGVASGGLDPIRAEALRELPRVATRRGLRMLELALAGRLSERIDRVRGLPGGDARRAAVERLIADARAGLALVRPMRVVLVGAPNAGKSSLMNRLVAFERSIVSEVAGTTVDRLAHPIAIDGFPFELSDTGGVMTARETGADPIHRQAAEVALDAARHADLVLAVVDPTVDHLDPQIKLVTRLRRTLKTTPLVIVHNKNDLPAANESVPNDLSPDIKTSAATGEGLDELRISIRTRLVPDPPAADMPVPFTGRQVEGLEELLADCSHASP